MGAVATRRVKTRKAVALQGGRAKISINNKGRPGKEGKTLTGKGRLKTIGAMHSARPGLPSKGVRKEANPTGARKTGGPSHPARAQTINFIEAGSARLPFFIKAFAAYDRITVNSSSLL